MDQLKLTCAFLGDPAREELWYVTQRNAMNFMMSIQEKRPSSPIDFVEAFPGTTDHSRDLLSMMLVWDPSRRASVSQCLASGYIRDLKSREDQETVRRLEAIPSHEVDLHDIESMPLTTANLRVKMFEEVAHFHDQLLPGRIRDIRQAAEEGEGREEEDDEEQPPLGDASGLYNGFGTSFSGAGLL